MTVSLSPISGGWDTVGPRSCSTEFQSSPWWHRPKPEGPGHLRENPEPRLRCAMFIILVLSIFTFLLFSFTIKQNVFLKHSAYLSWLQGTKGAWGCPWGRGRPPRRSSALGQWRTRATRVMAPQGWEGLLGHLLFRLEDSPS